MIHRDWSSDVCSSDLVPPAAADAVRGRRQERLPHRELRRLGRPGQPVKAASHAGGRLSPAGKYYQGKDTRPHFQGRASFLMRDSMPPKYANPICKNTP